MVSSLTGQPKDYTKYLCSLCSRHGLNTDLPERSEKTV